MKIDRRRKNVNEPFSDEVTNLIKAMAYCIAVADERGVSRKEIDVWHIAQTVRDNQMRLKGY